MAWTKQKRRELIRRVEDLHQSGASSPHSVESIREMKPSQLIEASQELTKWERKMRGRAFRAKAPTFQH